MSYNMRQLLSLIAVTVLAGCAGTDFVRPDSTSLRNGETTYGEVVAKMGEPRRQGSLMKNDKVVKTTSYSYAATGGKPLHEGVTPARAMVFYFYDDKLVGHEFNSSWAEDNTDFDETKIDSIIKGKTSRAQVEQLMGKPSGYYIYPLIKTESGQAAAYVYSEVSGSAFSLKASRKVLVVTLGKDDIVTDVEYSSVAR